MTLRSNPKLNAGQRNRSGWFSKTGSRGLDEVNQSGCYCCLSVNAISFSMSATKGKANMGDAIKKRRANQTDGRRNLFVKGSSSAVQREGEFGREKVNRPTNNAGQTRSESGPHTHTLDSGHSEGTDQAAREGTLGAYGRLYPTLPSCGQDGEYIFPMQEMPPSGGSQGERHNILQDNSFIGEYPVICSTHHVPRKGNQTAPPDYANYDATQSPQQFPLNPPVKQQPPAVRSGAVTKNESHNGRFDDTQPTTLQHDGRSSHSTHQDSRRKRGD